jgi:hypothetical protein
MNQSPATAPRAHKHGHGEGSIQQWPDRRIMFSLTAHRPRGYVTTQADRTPYTATPAPSAPRVDVHLGRAGGGARRGGTLR